ncbi:hypothetical protein D9Q98_008347 [Chlorella vulgaris]|uniref:Beta-fructofuranosidase n=1 Tax=Chlorella vulgaris TaxID=3077 RepID=A0A9D4TGI9_CHLVU|nr:hypothetical protein D9Q98_008347 [Chlorella vulgaris]
MTTLLLTLLAICTITPSRAWPYLFSRTEGHHRALSEQELGQVHQLAGEARRRPGLSASLKPGFHVTPPHGWMNDPNAPFEHRGIFHLFYQYNPLSASWDAPYWGHVASNDLVHWQQLPEALAPDAHYDSDGVFSGSATLLKNGTPAILYTGVSRYAELQSYYQVQGLAMPANASSDPLLRHWVKRPDPIIPLAPPGGSHAQFRDPTTATWVPAGGKDGPASSSSAGGTSSAGNYFMAIGVQLECQGAAALYESGPAFDAWTYRGVLFSLAALTRGKSNSTCPAPDGKEPAGGELPGEDLTSCPACSQFVEDCPMWECPDWFPVPASGGISAFKYSDQVVDRRPFGLEWYVLSDSPLNFASRAGKPPPHADSSAAHEGELFSAAVGGRPYLPQLFDHGEVYASKSSVTSAGQRVWFGWAYESSTCCDELCTNGTLFTEALGWQGAQVLPRVVTYDADTQQLLLNPVEAAASLRQERLYSGDLAFRGSGQSSVLVGSSAAAAADSKPLRQFELLAFLNLSSSLPPSEGQQRFSFSVGAVVEMGANSSLAISFNGTCVDDSSAGPRLAGVEMWVDTRRVGGATQGNVWGGPVTLPAEGLSASNMQLRVLVDHSLVEVFGLGGRQRTTVRAYPLDAEASWGIAMFADAPGGAVVASANVWEMASCWVDQLDLP